MKEINDSSLKDFDNKSKEDDLYMMKEISFSSIKYIKCNKENQNIEQSINIEENINKISHSKGENINIDMDIINIPSTFKIITFFIFSVFIYFKYVDFNNN